MLPKEGTDSSTWHNGALSPKLLIGPEAGEQEGYSGLWAAKPGQFYGGQARYLIVPDVLTPTSGQGSLFCWTEWWGEGGCASEKSQGA